MNKPYKEHNYYGPQEYQPDTSVNARTSQTAHTSQMESNNSPVVGESTPALTSQSEGRDMSFVPQHSSFLKKWGSLFVLGLALAIIIIDTTLLNVSLGTIIKELSTDIQSLQWVITAYSLTLAALTITGGRLGDLFGRKKMFMLGAIIFAVGSFMASVSNSVGMLLIGESLVEGVGAALMMPATSSLLVANFQGKDRGIAFGVWGGIAGAASAIGPILGGYLTKYYSWRWGFRINVFVVLLLLIGSLLVKESRDTEEKSQIDFIGVILSALGLLGVIYGFIQSSAYGWLFAKDSPVVFGYLIALGGVSLVPVSIFCGLVFLVLFFVWEKRVEDAGKTPLVSLSLFKNRAFTSGVLTTAMVSLGQVGLIFTLPVFFQSVLKLDALNTGLALLPLSLSLLIMAPLSGILSNRIPPKFIILTGLFFGVIASFVLRSVISVDATTASFIPGLIIYGAGMGMVMAQISNMTLSAVSVQQAGEASGVNNTMRQVGSSFGSAILGAVLLASLTSNLTTGLKASEVIPTQAKPLIVSAVSRNSSSVEFGGGTSDAGQLPQPITDEIGKIGKEATVAAVKQTFYYSAGFAFLGFLAAFSLPNKKPAPRGGTGAPVGGH
jgi:EmrB/QacA subfamily drug resistance transporter